MLRRSAAVLLSVLLLSAGWLGLTGITLLAAFVPLLWIVSSYDASRRSWWRVFGWALLTFAGWNIATVWWIWYATPVGPVAATLASTFLNMIAFMSFYTVYRRGPKPLAYTLLAAGWIATEYWYTVGDFSWPWLVLGNGFSHDVWAVQWYEYTGVFGGSLWVLLCNLLIFEAWRNRRDAKRWIAAACALTLPMALSLGIWLREGAIDKGIHSPLTRQPEVRVSIVQPNVDCYDKFHSDAERQERNIVGLLTEVPADAQFILLPETAVPGHYVEPGLSDWSMQRTPGIFWQELTDTLRSRFPQALLVTGANTQRIYAPGTQTATARRNAACYDEYPDSADGPAWPVRRQQVYYFDIFNSAVGLDSAGRMQLHHKGRLVIGVENTPTWIFDALKFLVIDLGGTLGQIGKGQHGTAFEHDGVKMGPAICYEGLYGDFYGDFVRRGAQFMAIISNDGWWGDTPGYRHLFTISRLRAIEHRRAIARSANTGMSGFISARGDVGETLGWEQTGVISAPVRLRSELTFYTRYGDYIGRIAQYLMLLCMLYYIAWRIKKKNHLVE